MNWQTFLEDNLTTAEDLRSPLKLTDEEYENIRQEIACYPMSVTKYYFSLINPDDPDDPIRKLAIPTGSTILPDGDLDTSEIGRGQRYWRSGSPCDRDQGRGVRYGTEVEA